MDTLGAYNENCPIQTPNIDRLANEGIRFDSGFALRAPPVKRPRLRRPSAVYHDFRGARSSPHSAALLSGKWIPPSEVLIF
jgi:hypothetical protein